MGEVARRPEGCVTKLNRKMLRFTHGRTGTSCGSKMENQREILAKSFHSGILSEKKGEGEGGGYSKTKRKALRFAQGDM